MAARYIQSGDRKIRIEFNWNTVVEFLDRCGIDMNEFVQLATGAKISPKHIRMLAWCGAIEGERIDGRVMELDEIAFGALLYPHTIEQVMQIFAEHFTGLNMAGDDKKKPQKKPVIFRLFR